MGILHMAGIPAALIDREQAHAELARRMADAFAGGVGAVVVDAIDGGDLARLAEALGTRHVLPRVLVVGSAGLARALATHYEARPFAPAEAGEPARPVMTVVGSFSKASLAQVQEVQDSGVAQVIRLETAHWLEPQHAALRQRTLVVARQHLRSHTNVLFAIAGEVRQPFSRSLVRAMARLTAPLLEYAGTCVLTGGDTARAMLNEVGVPRLDVSGEFEPGISIGHVAPYPSTTFVLKAGGFGDTLALQRIVGRFGPQRPPQH